MATKTLTELENEEWTIFPEHKAYHRHPAVEFLANRPGFGMHEAIEAMALPPMQAAEALRVVRTLDLATIRNRIKLSDGICIRQQDGDLLTTGPRRGVIPCKPWSMVQIDATVLVGEVMPGQRADERPVLHSVLIAMDLLTRKIDYFGPYIGLLPSTPPLSLFPPACRVVVSDARPDMLRMLEGIGGNLRHRPATPTGFFPYAAVEGACGRFKKAVMRHDRRQLDHRALLAACEEAREISNALSKVRATELVYYAGLREHRLPHLIAGAVARVREYREPILSAIDVEGNRCELEDAFAFEVIEKEHRDARGEYYSRVGARKPGFYWTYTQL